MMTLQNSIGVRNLALPSRGYHCEDGRWAIVGGGNLAAPFVDVQQSGSQCPTSTSPTTRPGVVDCPVSSTPTPHSIARHHTTTITRVTTHHSSPNTHPRGRRCVGARSPFTVRPSTVFFVVTNKRTNERTNERMFDDNAAESGDRIPHSRPLTASPPPPKSERRHPSTHSLTHSLSLTVTHSLSQRRRQRQCNVSNDVRSRCTYYVQHNVHD